jgi:hypothetical protein
LEELGEDAADRLREGGKEGGKEGGREGGKEGRREGGERQHMGWGERGERRRKFGTGSREEGREGGREDLPKRRSPSYIRCRPA